MPDNQLKYHLPPDDLGKIIFLCKLMEIPEATFNGLPQQLACDTLVNVVLYHHMNNHLERRKVIAKIRRLPTPYQNILINKVLDPLISPYWGIWSLSTNELFKQDNFFALIGTVGGQFGLTFSGASGYDIIRRIRTGVETSPIGIAMTVIIWGFFWANAQTQSMIKEEVYRRAGKRD